MKPKNTSCHKSEFFIDQFQPHDGESGNTSRPFLMATRASCGLNFSEDAVDTGEWILQSIGKREEKHEDLTGWVLAAVIVLFTVMTILILSCVPARADTASYYTKESCIAEGGSGIMANGREMQNDALLAASWDFKFGTLVRVTNLENSKSVVVVVSDRGPSKRLYKKGRKIDLSRGAFERIADTRKGIIPVRIERVI